jgi:mannose-6-phosphate isomerase-like protein (cupin superfamily)
MEKHAPQPVRSSVAVDPETGTIVGSAMMLSDSNVPGTQQCLGVATIVAGEPATAALAHSTSEVMFVADGRGELITSSGTIAFAKGDAIFIPQHLSHSLRNTGDHTLVSVFSFPSPNRPTDSPHPI